jgi:MFS family permease
MNAPTSNERFREDLQMAISATVRDREGVTPRIGITAWLTLAVLVFLYVLNTLDRGVLSLVVESVKHDLAISDFRISLLLGFGFAVFFAFCGLPIGWAIDRFPRRLILYLGVTVWSLATLACGLSQSFPQLLVARMLLGAGEATLGPAAHSIIADRFPRERMATALSVYTAGSVLGTGLSFAIGGMATSYFMRFDAIHVSGLGTLRPWQAVFACIGLPGLLLALLAFSFPEPPRQRVRSNGASARLWPFLRRRRAVFTSFALSFALFSMVIYGALGWLPVYMTRAFGWGPARIGSTLGVVNVVSAGLGTLLGGIAVDRLARMGRQDAHLRVFMTSIALAAPVGIVGFLVRDPTLFLVCVFWLELLGFSFIGYAAAAVQSVTPQALRARMAAMYLLALALIGNGGGSSLIAFFTDFVFGSPGRLGWSIAATILLLTPIALVAAWLGLEPMRRAVEEQSMDSIADEAHHLSF